MNKTSLMIKNRLSLRQPQTDSLEILEYLVDKLEMKKGINLKAELEKVKQKFPTCTDFERDFPSLCFALATGVGKTRLMGAFIAYLHIHKGINNFFVVAPNLTVYNKLIEDLKNPSNPKYVFKGIAEFANKPPRVITGENYDSQIAGQLVSSHIFSNITINVFNISKINRDAQKSRKKDEKDKLPRIKRLSEYLGESYFDYLSELKDLVLLMDESHHYRADKGLAALNELKPILGLEVTATPQVEKNAKTIKFKNVVYEYSLANAIKDGFVKVPAVATRKDFKPELFSDEELDKIKLEDGIRIHEETKVELEMYSRNHGVRYVKPFVLVVAKDTEHAGSLMKMIQSEDFFDGYYKDKVIEIHSNQKGSEKDENIEKLLSLESSKNKIEIVIHVNMLKEGWDVTNLYTIIPLRTAASTTLREQTIGRGLRLPYGERVGNDKVDKLTIVSHDKFQEILDESKRRDSIIRKENIIEIDETEINKPKSIVTSYSNIEMQLKQREKQINDIKDEQKKSKAKVELRADREILQMVSEISKDIPSAKDLNKKEIKEIVVGKIKERVSNDPQIQFEKFTEEIMKEVEERYEAMVEEVISNIIEIPRIIIQPTQNVKSGFHDFDLDIRNLNYQPSSETIMIKTLTDGAIEYIDSNRGKVKYDSLENIIVSELINYPEIDYDTTSELLFKLSQQVIDKFKSYLSDENDVINVVLTRKNEIGKYIYLQMKEHFYYDIPDYEEPKVYPFSEIKEHNLSKYKAEDIYDFKETIIPTSDIRKKVFGGFTKACHSLYKFDSKTEKDLVIILEGDDLVEKWLRPALGQFKIYWDYNSKQYLPDFVVETSDTIFIVETKKKKDIETREVQGKAKAALEYCKYASDFTRKNGGKQWKYILIPHDIVKQNMSFEFLSQNYEVKSFEQVK
ncbi:TPA: DEAD/DEAH box helicase family protein [Clostridium botulinum]|nr:DEAD/DEAH box helicase family protein [Clostridium botulinum]